MSAGEDEEIVNPNRMTDATAIPVEAASWFITTPFIHNEGPDDEELVDADVRVGELNGVIRLLLSATDEVATLEERVNLTPQQARDIAVTLWTCAEYTEKKQAAGPDGGDSA